MTPLTTSAQDPSVAQEDLASRWLRLLVRPSPCAELGAALARGTRSWAPLLDRIEVEGLGYRMGRDHLAPALLPAAVRARIDRLRAVQTAWTLLALADLEGLLRGLGFAGVETLVLKGPALAVLQGFASQARAFGDLDLLVRRSNRHRAEAVLRAKGYVPDWPVAPEPASPFRYSTAVSFRRAGHASVDLHWGLSTPLVPFHLEQTGVWRRSQRLDLGCFSCQSLGNEDAFLHACVHAAKDDWTRWSHVADIAALLHRLSGLDFDLLRALAERTGSRRLLRTALLLAHDLAEAPMQYEILAWAQRDPGARAIARGAKEDLMLGRARDQGIRLRLVRAWQVRERKSDRLRSALGALVRASEPRPGETWPAWSRPLRRPARVLLDLRRDDRPALGGK